MVHVNSINSINPIFHLTCINPTPFYLYRLSTFLRSQWRLCAKVTPGSPTVDDLSGIGVSGVGLP